MIQAQIVYMNAQQNRAVLPLPAHGATIGRGTECTIGIPDLQVSLRHAMFKLVNNAWHIEDQRSTNGTMVNGNRINVPTRLRHLDVISCGSLQLHFFLVAGSEQATLGESGAPVSRESEGDQPGLRSENSVLKKERDALLEKLEKEDRELVGANAENRQLRQVQEELRAQHGALRRQYDQGIAALGAAQAKERAALAELDQQSTRLRELAEQGRMLKATAEAQVHGRQQAEREAVCFKDRIAAIEAERDALVQRRDEALDAAQERQSELEALRRTSGDWDRFKAESDAERRLDAARIQQLLATLDEKQATLHTVQKDLSNLRQRYDDKNEQHRGLRSEFDQLSNQLERHQDQAKRQSERLARDKEELRVQVQVLQQAAAQSLKGTTEDSLNQVRQIKTELRCAHGALAEQSEALLRVLSTALRLHPAACQANPVEPAGLRVRDAIEQASARAEQVKKLLQQLASACD